MPSLAGAGKGALTGAGIGSMFGGPVGAGIGAGVGGLIGLFKGGKKKSKPGSLTPGSPEAQLQTSADKSGQLADTLGQQAQESIQPAQQYFKGLLSSNPSELMAATAPERGRVIDQYDAARQATAEFGPKGGGTASTLAASRTQQAQQLGDILSTGKREAATASSQLGTTLSGLGMTAKQLQSADLNTILNSILTREGFDIQKRGQTMEAVAGIGEGVGSILGGMLAKA